MQRALLKWPQRTGPLVSLLCLLASGCDLPGLTGNSSDGETAAEVPTATSPSSGSGGSSSAHSPAPSPTTGVTAPEIASPPPGSEVSDAQPTLTVHNSTTGDPTTPKYQFELATDPNFSQVVGGAEDLPQGQGGTTAWQVEAPLTPGLYYWRAQARAGLIRSPYSSIADFEVVAPPEPTPAGGGVLVFDPLAGGMSLGEVHGGTFVEDGWRVQSKSDFIRYEVPSIENGYVAWENRGLQPANPSADQFMLFGMWDPSRGDYRANPFRVHVQKLDTNHNPPYVRLRWIANGEQHDRGFDFLNWDPSTVYRWQLDWSPQQTGHVVRVFLNGQLIIEQPFQRPYQPAVHWIELGIAERQESIVGTVYSNVEIGAR